MRRDRFAQPKDRRGNSRDGRMGLLDRVEEELFGEGELSG